MGGEDLLSSPLPIIIMFHLSPVSYIAWFLYETFVGITTLVGGGTGPADGTRATTCTPAPAHMRLMLQSTDELPLNFGFTGKVGLLFFIFLLSSCISVHACYMSTESTVS